VITVATVKQTRVSRPCLWQGSVADGRLVYACFRWGRLTVHVSPEPTDDALDAADADPVVDKELGEEAHGSITYNELKAATRGVVVWP
jgi:hypothetical protein